MGAQPSPGGDELRARAYLRALRVRPFGHQEPPVSDRPIVPSRVIPAGAPLPARPPEPGEVPPWRPAPPPPPAPPADPPPPDWPPTGPTQAPDQVVRVIHEIVLAPPPAPEPEPSRWSRLWDAITARVAPWKAVIAVFATVTPIPWTGYSPASTWLYTVSEAREMHVGFGYGLAFGTLALAVNKLVRGNGGTVCLFFSATTFVGLFGAMSWYDPIHWLTGVPR